MKDLIREAVREQIRLSINPPAQAAELEETALGDFVKKLVTVVGVAGALSGALVAALNGSGKGAVFVGVTGTALSFVAGAAAKIAVDKKIFLKIYDELIDAVERRDVLMKNVLKIPEGPEQDDMLETTRVTINTYTKKMARAADKMKAFMLDPSNEGTIKRLNAKELAKLEVFIEAAEEGRLTTLEKQLMKLSRQMVVQL